MNCLLLERKQRHECRVYIFDHYEGVKHDEKSNVWINRRGDDYHKRDWSVRPECGGLSVRRRQWR
jgi:hypothetical protein